ncbi:MAG: hypothetical protein Q9167_006978 [Letrouitia subvulpina]
MAENEIATSASSENKGAMKNEKSHETQIVEFLISCIRHSNVGKINFGKVAEECGIVSKGAAAKRYERLMKAHGLHPSSAIGGSASTVAATNDASEPVKFSFVFKAKPTVSKKDATSKKRKALGSEAEDQVSGEEKKATTNKRSRKQPVKKSAEMVKDESEDEAG